jgi:hypothetical protein
MTSLLKDPTYWHSRAVEAERRASRLRDPIAKAASLELAEIYEEHAAAAQRKIEAGGKNQAYSPRSWRITFD